MSGAWPLLAVIVADALARRGVASSASVVVAPRRKARRYMPCMMVSPFYFPVVGVLGSGFPRRARRITSTRQGAPGPRQCVIFRFILLLPLFTPAASRGLPCLSSAGLFFVVAETNHPRWLGQPR